MKENQDVWIFIEQNEGKLVEVSFELLSKGLKLARSLKSELKAVIIGHKLEDITKETFKYGANEAFVIDHPDLFEYKTLSYSKILSEIITSYQPRIVLFGATFIGRDLAPRIASHTKSGLTADCTDLQISNVNYLRKEYQDLLLQIRPAFGGNIIATIISPDSPIQMATVREGVMEQIPLDKPVPGKITPIPYQPDDFQDVVTILERHREEKKVNLKATPIIVAGGYGMGSKENFNMLYELAETLGGEVAGTRAAVDAGYISPDRQVGQTGVTVRPKLYIACGISGAIQHRAGMEDSQKIIAINTDPEAPIFDVCHYRILGDVNEVIPTLIETYRHKLR
jgi:electron transfer flavoprotein alpha subunit